MAYNIYTETPRVYVKQERRVTRAVNSRPWYRERLGRLRQTQNVVRGDRTDAGVCSMATRKGKTCSITTLIRYRIPGLSAWAAPRSAVRATTETGKSTNSKKHMPAARPSSIPNSRRALGAVGIGVQCSPLMPTAIVHAPYFVRCGYNTG